MGKHEYSYTMSSDENRCSKWQVKILVASPCTTISVCYSSSHMCHLAGISTVAIAVAKLTTDLVDEHNTFIVLQFSVLKNSYGSHRAKRKVSTVLSFFRGTLGDNHLSPCVLFVCFQLLWATHIFFGWWLPCSIFKASNVAPLWPLFISFLLSLESTICLSLLLLRTMVITLGSPWSFSIISLSQGP